MSSSVDGERNTPATSQEWNVSRRCFVFVLSFVCCCHRCYFALNMTTIAMRRSQTALLSVIAVLLMFYGHNPTTLILLSLSFFPFLIITHPLHPHSYPTCQLHPWVKQEPNQLTLYSSLIRWLHSTTVVLWWVSLLFISFLITIVLVKLDPMWIKT